MLNSVLVTLSSAGVKRASWPSFNFTNTFYDANHKIASNLPSAQITDKSGFSFSICGKRHNHQFSFVKETKVKHK